MRKTLLGLVLAIAWMSSACADFECPMGFIREGKVCKRCPDGGRYVDGECTRETEGGAEDGDDAGMQSIDAGRDASPDASGSSGPQPAPEGGMPAMDAGSTPSMDAGTTSDAQVMGTTDSAATVDTGTPTPDASAPTCDFACKLNRGRRITAGWHDTCVVNNAGSVYCWGNNDEGEVGDGTQTIALAPKKVALPGKAVAVSLKGYFSCALLESGEVYCWGQNTTGQIGIGSTSDRELTPRKAMISNVVEIEAGGRFTCARQNNASTIRCWGIGTMLGLGSAQQVSPIPLMPNVSGLTDFKAFGASGANACVLHTSGGIAGRVSCWGWNLAGQTGISPMTSMWTYDPTLISGVSSARILAVGARHNCVVSGDRDISCWGWNAMGQLGNGGGDDSISPVVVSGTELQSKVRDLFAGGTHSCAIVEPNTLVCWGGNDLGQLGLGDRVARSSPTRVSGISARALQGAAGDYHTCVYLETDDVACWGSGINGALGTGGTADELTPRVVVVPND